MGLSLQTVTIRTPKYLRTDPLSPLPSNRSIMPRSQVSVGKNLLHVSLVPYRIPVWRALKRCKESDNSFFMGFFAVKKSFSIFVKPEKFILNCSRQYYLYASCHMVFVIRRPTVQICSSAIYIYFGNQVVMLDFPFFLGRISVNSGKFGQFCDPNAIHCRSFAESRAATKTMPQV